MVRIAPDETIGKMKNLALTVKGERKDLYQQYAVN
jgi:hypothetical protein